MKLLVIATTLLLSTTALAQSAVEGRWEGKAYVASVELPTPILANIRVVVTRKGDKLNIWECFWAFPSGRLPVGTCNETDFQITNESNLEFNGKRVGDLGPRRINTLVANTQAAEQIVLQLEGENSLNFTYSYVNNDGDSIYRRATLMRPTEDKPEEKPAPGTTEPAPEKPN